MIQFSKILSPQKSYLHFIPTEASFLMRQLEKYCNNETNLKLKCWTAGLSSLRAVLQSVSDNHY